MKQARVVALTVLVSILAGGRALARQDSNSASQEYDCGTLALYSLLRLEGRSADLATIDRFLSHPVQRRDSLKDLQVAARACGLDLDGVQLPKSDTGPAQLALVHLDRKPDGHFLLVRPVGFTRKLVQVIDSSHPPFVMDAANLYASPEWTGLALVPSRRNWPVRAAGFLSIIAGLSLVVWARLRKKPIRMPALSRT